MFWLALITPLALAQIQFHMIPHTHDDLGWLKTVDEYYYGDKNNIAFAGVQYILDTLVRALEDDPTRKFTYVEMGFFWRWWEQQTDDLKQRVRNLVANEQLQFVNGGWVMSDEAATYYEDIIDQMAVGHQFLLQEFNYKPYVAWHIDPFGHSAANTDLFAKMGFQAMFFERLDYQDKAKRLQDLSLEMIWRPYISTGYPSELFTHAFYYGYYFPPTFCLDDRCDEDPPIMGDSRLENNNFQSRVQDYGNFVFDEAEYFRTDQVLVNMGGDFAYQNSFYNFRNMDLLKEGLYNTYQHNSTFIYSTPNDYLDSIHKKGLRWPSKTDDFMPYASAPHSYWTGYYTSRPTLKGFVRSSGAYLRAAQNFFVNEMLKGYVSGDDVQEAHDLFLVHRRKMGLLQHHDAVTGTERQAVTYDYAKLLNIGESHTDYEMFQRLEDLVARRTNQTNLQFGRCPLMNQTLCDYTAELYTTATVVELAVFNPNMYTVTRLVEVPVPIDNLEVIDQENQLVLMDLMQGPPSNFTSANNYTIYFRAKVPALTTNLYKIRTTQTSYDSGMTKLSPSDKFLSRSSHFTLQTQGNNFNIFNDITNITLTLKYSYYVGASDAEQASGAYIFRPDPNISPRPLDYAKVTESYEFKGNVVDVLVTKFGDKVTSTLTVDKQSPHLTMTNFINSIDVSDQQGKEIVQILQSTDAPPAKFYTDSNGMGMMERVWNSRPTFDVDYNNEPVASNYYPINSAIVYNNYALVTDRPVAGTVTPYNEQAAIETLVHRRLLFDDNKGVSEALNELDPYEPTQGLRLIYKNILVINNSDSAQRTAEDELQTPLQLFFARTNLTEFEVGNIDHGTVDIGNQWRVRMLPIQDKSFRMRVQNRFGGGTFDLNSVLQAFGHSSYNVTELGLSENQPMKDIKENHWQWLTFADEFLSTYYDNEFKDVDYDFNANEVKSYKIDLLG